MNASQPDKGVRALALDVGGKRIGVAISDAEGRIAMPLTTLKANPRTRVLAQIAALVAEHEVAEVIIGLPLSLNGDVGPQAQATQAFADELAARLTQPIHLFDERLTTIVAEQILRDMGVKPEKRKERIDEMAACIILKDYLDQKNGTAI